MHFLWCVCKLYQNRYLHTKNTAEKSAVFFYPNRRFGISSRFSVYLISSCGAVYHYGEAVHTISCGLMIYNTVCWWYAISTKLMIYKAHALILVWYYAIINSPKIKNLTGEYYEQFNLSENDIWGRCRCF